MPLDDKPIDAVKPETATPDVDDAAGDEFDEGLDDAGAEEGDDGESGSLIDNLDDGEDGGDETVDGKKAEGKPDPSLATVPKTADGYVVPAVEGLELNEADQTALGKYMTHAHKHGANQAAVHAGLSFYKELRQAQVALDAQTAKATKEELVGDLGSDGFKTEKGRLQNALKAMPEGLGNDILNARLADGRKLINDARFFRWMQNQNAKSRVPTASDRMAEIERIMKTDINSYYEQGLSDEYGRLLAAKEGSR